MGCRRHPIFNQHRRLRISQSWCELQHFCKTIWVRRRIHQWHLNIRHLYFSYENVRVTTFPCYYSRAFNQIVVARYSWDDNLKHLILSIIIPNVLFAVSIGVLSYWYCPCCDKACHKNPRVYAEFPNAKEK